MQSGSMSVDIIGNRTVNSTNVSAAAYTKSTNTNNVSSNANDFDFDNLLDESFSKGFIDSKGNIIETNRH